MGWCVAQASARGFDRNGLRQWFPHKIHEHCWYPSSVWSAGFGGGYSDHRLLVEAYINRFRITTDVPVVFSLSGNRWVTYTQSGDGSSIERNKLVCDA